LRPTETRHSPELREARRRQVELEREERRKRREARLKEEVDEQGNRHPADEEEAVTEAGSLIPATRWHTLGYVGLKVIFLEGLRHICTIDSKFVVSEIKSRVSSSIPMSLRSSRTSHVPSTERKPASRSLAFRVRCCDTRHHRTDDIHG
ncbi:unnamed protein product, partial [Symbiodinium necroappetens]